MAFMVMSNHFAKGFSNKASGTRFTWWKTSFNMPVTNIFDNSSIYTETEGMLNSIGEATSFDLSGFEAGWEVIAASVVYTIYGPFAGGNITVSQTWKNPSGSTIYYGANVWACPALTSAQWNSYQLVTNQGVASWEIATSGTYQLVAGASGAYTDSNSFNVSFTNVPSVSTYTPGMVWVESDNLRWTSANGHIHTMVGSLISSPSATPGMIWVEGNYICWIGSSGNKYQGQFNFRQFSSFFVNGPSPGVVSGQTPGYIWMDQNFGWEHIGYIASDGYKWINNSGNNPYA